MGLFKAIGGALKKVAGPALSAIPGVGPIASLALSAGSAYLGNRMDAARDRGALRDKYSFMEGKGLTPQEIAGSGFSANPSSGATSVLGNQAAQQAMAQRQMDFQQSERDKDRAIQMRAQDMGLRQSQISAGVGYQANALAAQRLNEIDLPQAGNDLITTSPAFRLRQLELQMGPDNYFVDAIAQRRGIELNNGTISEMSQSDWRSFVREVQSFKSQAATETAGASGAVSDAFSGYGAALSGLGNKIGSFNPLRPENWPTLGSGSQSGGYGPDQRY